MILFKSFTGQAPTEADPVDRRQAVSSSGGSWQFSTHWGRQPLASVSQFRKMTGSVERTWKGRHPCLDSAYPELALPFALSAIVLPLFAENKVSTLHGREFQLLSDDRK